jgi:hypothetical protein
VTHVSERGKPPHGLTKQKIGAGQQAAPHRVPTRSRELPRVFPQKARVFFRGSLTGAPLSLDQLAQFLGSRKQ